MKASLRSNCVWVLLSFCLVCFGAAQAMAQATEEPATTDPVASDPIETDPATPVVEDQDGLDPEATEGTNPPPFILNLLESSDLKQDQLDQMRTDGAGWGNIRIMVLLAERISDKSEGVVSFDDALAEVLAARAAGKGFGEIAGENGLQVGETIRNRNRQREGSLEDGPGDGDGDGLQAQETIRVQEKRRGVFARLAGFLGFKKAEKPEKAAAPERLQRAERPEKPSKPEKLERPERPERPEKPEKPEKPERPERPEKPEKPERGPNR